MTAFNDPNVLAMRAEIAVMAFEGCFSQVKGAARFLELAEYEMAIAAIERAMPFWASALDEMRAIRTAVRTDALTASAAAEYRAQRDGENLRRRKVDGEGDRRRSHHDAPEPAPAEVTA